MWINRLLHVGNKTYIFDKSRFCLLNFPNDFLQIVKNRQNKNILKN